MKQNENGFGALGVLAVAIIVGLIGTIGWLVYDRQNTEEVKTETETSLATGNSTEGTTSDEESNEQPLEVANFSQEITLPNEETATLIFNYPKDWSVQEDTGSAIILAASPTVSVTVSYSEGGSAPTQFTEVTHGNNTYRRFEWGPSATEKIIRYFPVNETGNEFNPDGIQHISIAGPNSDIGEIDDQISLLLSSIAY